MYLKLSCILKPIYSVLASSCKCDLHTDLSEGQVIAKENECWTPCERLSKSKVQPRCISYGISDRINTSIDANADILQLLPKCKRMSVLIILTDIAGMNFTVHSDRTQLHRLFIV